MTYNVEFSTQAKKFIKNLDKNESLRILDKFDEIKIDPFRFIEHYEGQGFKIRIGDFRALIDIDTDNRKLYVRVFDKRGRIYK